MEEEEEEKKSLERIKKISLKSLGVVGCTSSLTFGSMMATGGREESRANGVLNIGTAVPNRIFVGGISSKTNEEDLRNLFSKYGNVTATKIIVDKAGTSKGYGFVTFETEEEAQKVLIEVDCLTLKDRKLNVAPAVKKHPYNRNLESGSLHTAPVMWSSHPYSGSASFPSREPIYYPQGTWPLLWHQQLYLPQQYPYPQTPQPGYPQYLYSIAPEYTYPTVGTDYSETSSADSGESGKNRSRASTPAPPTTEYDKTRSAQTKTCHVQSVCVPKYNGSCVDSPSNCTHTTPVPQMHHVLAKTVNGVVMAYPTSFLMGGPTIVHMRENSDSDTMSDIGYIHSPVASGALTPPPTPMASLSCDFNVNTSIESLRKS